jgi:hypothetical protein
MRCSALQAAMAKADAIHVQLTAEPTRVLVLSHAPTLLPIEHSSHPGWGIERCAATLNPCEYYGFRPAVVATAQWAWAASHAYGWPSALHGAHGGASLFQCSFGR